MRGRSRISVAASSLRVSVIYPGASRKMATTARHCSGRPAMRRPGSRSTSPASRGAPRAGGVGSAALASIRGHHLLSWQTASGMRVYASKDLHAWRRTRHFSGSAFLDPAVTPSGFLVSVRRGPMDGQRTISAYMSHDGETWRRISDLHPPQMSGLSDGVRFRGEYFALDLSVAGASRVMHSADDRVWSPVNGSTPQKLEGHLVGDTRRGILGAEWFDVSTAKAVDARGAFVTSSDGSNWHEVESFRRQFPHADLVAVARVGAWWIVGGPVTEAKPGRSRPWAFWTTRDLVALAPAPDPARAPVAVQAVFPNDPWRGVRDVRVR